MTPLGLALSMLSAALICAVLSGLVVRHRLAASACFPLYLLVGLVARVPAWVAPDHFYDWRWFFQVDLAQAALRLAVAVELCWLAFRGLPAGRTRAAALLAVVLVLTLASVVAAPQGAERLAGEAVYYAAVVLLQRVSYGAVWLFAIWVGLVWRYGLPTDPLHREIAAGFLVWSILLATADQLSALDPWLKAGASAVAKLSYPLLLAAWAWAAWRKDPGTQLSPSALAFLQPWRRIA